MYTEVAKCFVCYYTVCLKKTVWHSFSLDKKFVPLDTEPRNSQLPFETKSYVQTDI
jgi:hypothetical protein